MRSVPHSCRARLQRRDFRFIAQVLTGVQSGDKNMDALIRLTRDEEALTQVLDDPQLLNSILTVGGAISISAELYFYVLVRHGLIEAGIDHPNLTDYVASTLAEYSKGNPLKPETGEKFEDATYYVDFFKAMSSANSHDRFFLEVRCGNQFLMLSGLFPKFLKRRETRRGAPGIAYYESVASASFRHAAEHPLAGEFAVNEIYPLLAELMPQTRKALNRLGSEYLFLDA
ncbi:MAG: hypothetical protein ACI8UO_001723 [Verrucomicrobiales bacterium]|jgi:hypothetical protein